MMKAELMAEKRPALWGKKLNKAMENTNGTHKNQRCVEVCAIFLLKLLIMLICQIFICIPECGLPVCDGDLWLECLD
jgi:hypothetical protein